MEIKTKANIGDYMYVLNIESRDPLTIVVERIQIDSISVVINSSKQYMEYRSNTKSRHFLENEFSLSREEALNSIVFKD